MYIVKKRNPTQTSCSDEPVCSFRCELVSRRLTKDTARFKDELDVMKFICKDFWTCVFKKQIDNLRTNHQVEAGSLMLSSDFTATSAWLCPRGCHEQMLWLLRQQMCPYSVWDLDERSITDKRLMNPLRLSPLKGSEGVVDVSGHLRPPGQHVSVTESTVSRKAVSGPGSQGTPVQTSAALCCPSVECVKVERCVCVCSTWPSPAAWWEELCSAWGWRASSQLRCPSCLQVRPASVSRGNPTVSSSHRNANVCFHETSAQARTCRGQRSHRPAVTWSPPLSPGLLMSHQSDRHSDCLDKHQETGS